MLSDDKQINKDFNINNHYINLNFNDWEQEFEFKWPHLDHPSNYQMIVTKFMMRNTFPYIVLHESKKNPKIALTQNDLYYFDYLVRMDWNMVNLEDSLMKDTFYLQKLFPDQLTSNEAPMLRTILEDNPYLDANGDVIDDQDEEAKDWKPTNFNNRPRGDYRLTGKGWKANQFFWYDRYGFNSIFSIEEFLSIINKTLKYTVNYFLTTSKVVYQNDEYLMKVHDKLHIADEWIYYRLNNGRLELVILEDLAKIINSSNKYEHKTQSNLVLDEKGNIVHDENGKPKYNVIILKDNRYIRFAFSENLFRYLRSIHLERNWEDNNFYTLNITEEAVNQAERFTRMNGLYELTYCVFKGEKINIMDWSDFVGIAVTSPDFPVKQQVYPHFFYDFEEDYEGRVNRRRTTNDASEFNIEGFKPTSGAVGVKYTQEMFGDEDQNEQYMKGVEEPIVFLKYFNKDEDFNCLNYENNDGNTSLRMDIKNVMPLQKFTMRIYLIDRWGNFTPIACNKCKDTTIQMQILFQRIKGAEKENRYIIEPEKRSSEPVITAVYKDPETGETVIQDNLKVPPRKRVEYIQVPQAPQPQAPLPPPPAPPEERKEDIEEELGPENELY